MKRDGGFGGALNIPCRTSRIVLLLECIMHAGALIAVILSAIPGWARILAVPLVAASYILWFRRHYIDRSGAARGMLQLTARDEWRLLTGAGEALELRLEPNAFVHPLLLVLSFAAAGRRLCVLLLPDNTDADTLRRLRVRLGYGGASDNC